MLTVLPVVATTLLCVYFNNTYLEGITDMTHWK